MIIVDYYYNQDTGRIILLNGKNITKEEFDSIVTLPYETMHDKIIRIVLNNLV